MPWPISYLLITIIAIVILKLEKRGQVGIVACFFALFAAAFAVMVWSWSALILIIFIKFLALALIKMKALILKKLGLIILGSLGMAIPFLNIIIICVLIYYIWHYLIEFYHDIFEWLQDKLCDLRDFFDNLYDRVPLSSGYVGLLVAAPIFLVEFFLISGITILTLAGILGAVTSGTPSLLQGIFTFVLSAGVGLQMFVSYRYDTDIMHRLRGEGLDYGLISWLSPFDDMFG